MVSLSLEDVRLMTSVRDKAEAIRQAGQLLVASGHIHPSYIDSMIARETQANTFLGNGIAIPHGLPEDRELILKTGISVTQIPHGVVWNPGEIVHLVVGIAAKSDEHLQILANLTQVLADPVAVSQLVQTDNPQEIVDRLTRGVSATPSDSVVSDLGQAVDLVITNAHGLHARPAAVFVDRAKSFQAEIRVRRGDQSANGKSLMALLQLGVKQNDTIHVSARGGDAGEALAVLQAEVADGLAEAAADPITSVSQSILTLASEAIAGVPASPGIALAPLYHYQRKRLVFSDTATDIQAEAEKLTRAIATAQGDLNQLYQTVSVRAGRSKAAIFQAHREFLDDPDLRSAVIDHLKPNRSAAWAWQQVIESRASALAAMADPILSGRAVDVRDVGQRVLMQLADRVESTAALPDYPVILIADDLTPSDTAGFTPDQIRGFCTVKGGATSHTAIIARSLNIPAVVGAGVALQQLTQGQTAVLDGDRGCLYPTPTEADLAATRQAIGERQALQDVEQRDRFQPAITRDGHRIEVVANIGSTAEAAQAIAAGGEGVGLLRTEFLFLQRTTPPTEAEQFAALQEMVRALDGLPLIVRTLDIGGDKDVPYLHLLPEANPFLGVRGVRLCLQRPDLFEPHLRAILRAAQQGYLRVMFPMIATLDDIRGAKAALESVRISLDVPPIEIGMMVEVPSAVLMAEAFAPEVDFFSVGTNDLTQYLLAMDRGHPTLAKQADGLHPVVLRAIAQTVQAAKTADKWVGVCGGIAADPLGAILLAGLGVNELSVSLPRIPTVKAQLRRQTFKQMQRLAQKALQCHTAEEVRRL